MSEFLASAEVLILPDTTKFAAELEAQLVKAISVVKVPPVVVPVAVVTEGAAAAGAVAASATEAAVATQAATAAAEQRAGALGVESVAARQATAAEIALADVQKTNLALQEQLTAATAAGVLATTRLAESKAVLAATSKVVASAEENVASALATGNAAAIADARSTLAVAEAQQLAARTAAIEAAALVRSGAAAGASARAHEQLGRGAAASTLSLLNVRGATLAASSDFLIGAAAITLVAKSVKQASEEQEALARVSRILGDELGRGSEEWSKKLASSFGLADDEALKFEGAIAQVFTNVRVSQEENARLSQQLVQRAADVAARANVPVETVLRAFQLSLSGNLRGLRQFVPAVTTAEIAQEALAESGKKAVAQLTRQELVLARANVLLRDSANQAGSFAQRADDLAAQTKILNAELSDLGDEFGGFIIPFLVEAAKDANLLFEGLRKLSSLKLPVVSDLLNPKPATGGGGGFGNFAANFARNLVGPFAVIKEGTFLVSELRGQIEKLTASTRDTEAPFNELLGPLGQDEKAFQSLTGTMDTFSEHAGLTGLTVDQVAQQIAASLTSLNAINFTHLQNQLDTLLGNVKDVALTGGSLQEQLAALGPAAERARREFNTAQRGVDLFAGTPGAPGAASAKKRLEKARSDLQGVLDQQDSIRNQIAADARAKQSAAEKAAREAQAALDKADRAFLDALGLGEGQRQQAILRAQATKGLRDDIQTQQQLRAFLAQQIAAAKATIHDATQRAQTVQALSSELEQTRQAIADLIVKSVANRFATRQAAAAQTASAIDDLVGQRTVSAAYRAAIAQALKTIKDVRLRRIVVEALTAALRESDAAVKDYQAEAKKQARANLETSLDLDIDFARTNKNIAAERKAHEAKIRFLKEQQSHTKRGTIEWKRLRNEIADENAAIKALKPEVDKSAEAQFAFLQAQQGFAATLLSNLLSIGAVKGTVGGGPGVTPPAAPAAPGPGGAVLTQSLGEAAAASAAAGAVGGVTQSQFARLLQLTEGILGALTGIAGQRQHPEAKIAVAAAKADMAFLNW